MSPFEYPTDRSTPISSRRLMTAINIVFAMVTAATSNEMPPTPMRNWLIVLKDCSTCSRRRWTENTAIRRSRALNSLSSRRSAFSTLPV